jgi:hypothetical protein
MGFYGVLAIVERTVGVFNPGSDPGSKKVGIRKVSASVFQIRFQIGYGFKRRVCGSGSGFGVRIRIQEAKNDPQRKKVMKFHV